MAERTQPTQVEALTRLLEGLQNVDIDLDVVLKVRHIRDKKAEKKTSDLPSPALRENQALARRTAQLIPQDAAVTLKWISDHVTGIMTHQKATKVVAAGIDLGVLECIEPEKKSGERTYRALV